MSDMPFEIDETYLINTRRYLHAHPELSLHEYETAAYIEAQLSVLGIERRRVGETGVPVIFITISLTLTNAHWLSRQGCTLLIRFPY